jgi:1,4-alpha-glucan branching enzyme
MRRSVRLTPVVAFAMAAGIAAIAVAASLSLRPAVPAATVAAAPDTVHVVRFMLVAPGASQVALVGSFNQWDKGATLLEPGPESGVWTVTMPLPAGRHEYAFVVSDANGERWVADRYVQRVTDEYGVESSVLSVGGLPTT